MAAKKNSSLGPKVRKLLEKAMLEALKRHYGKPSSASPKKKTSARKKKVARKAPARKKKATRRRA
jgi:hypothetical protein